MGLRRTLHARVDAVIAVAVAAHVFSIILAQTKVFDLLSLGIRLRWVTLAALLAVAVSTLALSGVDRRVRIGLPVLLSATLLALALVSRAWTAAPNESVFTIPDNLGTNRALALGALLTAAAALAAAGRAAAVARGVVFGAAAVAVAGLLVLVVDRDAGMEPATTQHGPRFNGLGGNPNAAAALEALALPLAVGLALAAGRWRAAIRWWTVVALFVGSIAASASRGAMLAAAAGALVAVPPWVAARRRLVAAGAIVAVAAAALVVSHAPDPDPLAAPPPPPADREPPPPPAPNPFDVQQRRPLQDDIGWTNVRFRRTVLGSGGRAAAMKGAAEQALERPLLGYGFGYEEHVFADRYAVFNAQRPENAYIGTALQIGLVGLALMLALIASLALAARPLHARAVAPFAGVVAAGLLLGLTQSFALAAGSSATAAFWLSAFAMTAAAASVANAK